MSRNTAKALFTNATHDYNAAAMLVDRDLIEVGDQVFGNEFIHELDKLFAQISSKVSKIPDRFSRLEILTPFAAHGRYDVFDSPPLQRKQFIELAHAFMKWIGERMT